jgi:hypothetical protein
LPAGASTLAGQKTRFDGPDDQRDQRAALRTILTTVAPAGAKPNSLQDQG